MESPVAPAPLPAPDAIQRFGTFHLGEFELALPIGALQEVVSFPAAIARIPLAPAHLLGLIDLRGMLLPVVHLGRLLGLAEEGDRADSRIAIVACGDVRLGVLFERTGEMLRLPARQVVPFRHDGEAPALIEGAFRAGPDGRILAAAYTVATRLQAVLGEHHLVDASPIIDGCRMRKSGAELALMRQATAMTLQVQRLAAGVLHEGISNHALVHFIDEAHRALRDQTSHRLDLS